MCDGGGLVRRNRKRPAQTRRRQVGVVLRKAHAAADCLFRRSGARYGEDDVVDLISVAVASRRDGQDRVLRGIGKGYRNCARSRLADAAVGLAKPDPWRLCHRSLQLQVEGLVAFVLAVVDDRERDLLARFPFAARRSEVGGLETNRCGRVCVIVGRLCPVRSGERSDRDVEACVGPRHVGRSASNERRACRGIVFVEAVGRLLRPDRDRRVRHDHLDRRRARRAHLVVVPVVERRGEIARLRRPAGENRPCENVGDGGLVRRDRERPAQTRRRQVGVVLRHRHAAADLLFGRARSCDGEDDVVDLVPVGDASRRDGEDRRFLLHLRLRRAVESAHRQEQHRRENRTGARDHGGEAPERRSAAASRLLRGCPGSGGDGMAIGHVCVPPRTKTPRTGSRARRCIRAGSRLPELPVGLRRRGRGLGGGTKSRRAAAGGSFDPQAADEPAECGARGHCPLPRVVLRNPHPSRMR